ncbi:hypothetical protein DFJ58DRAFT_826605 [Suillus subalutaceus]|uniref:uncharacterized protein n=1 Tax=Suillus subalutaceus TaxID=48586 RepID=UPI001B87FE5E|nr:uncharacterized protein DFJ58DRAFT_826605 [Suillus subalutaceus]KAG1828764.1 hypothetical protein DFJ58DRAFT_826605 [Suillus subalutaceus]
MSSGDQDTFITISARSYDSGRDFLKALLEGDIYAPYGRIESQPLDLPDDWKLPSQPFTRPDLEELWRDVSQRNGVNMRVVRLKNPGAHTFTMLLILLVCGACMLILDHSFEIADRSSKENYEALSNLSASLLAEYAVCQSLSRLRSEWMAFQQFATFRKPGMVEVLVCLAFTRIAEASLALSLASLATCTRSSSVYTKVTHWPIGCLIQVVLYFL